MAKIESIQVQVLCHATEDEEKVMKAVENVLGSEALEKVTVLAEALQGHYGDQISLIKLSLRDSRLAEEVLKNILSRLSEEDRAEIWKERLKRGKHGGKLYLRLDKQAAYLGSLKISDKDPIRVQVNIRGRLESFRRRIEEELK